MFSGRLSQIPMLNLLLKDMEICRALSHFAGARKQRFPVFLIQTMGKLRRKIIGKGFPIFALNFCVILNGLIFFFSFFGSNLISVPLVLAEIFIGKED